MSARERNTVNRYVVNMGATVLTTLLSMTALLWVNQYLLRRIAPEEYALVPVLFALLIVFELVQTVFAGGLARFMVEADAKDDPGEMTRIVSSMAPVLFLLSLIIGVAGCVAAWRIDEIVVIDPAYLSDARIMFALLVGTLCLNLATVPFRVGFVVKLRFVAENLIVLGGELLRIVLLVWLLVGVEPQALWLIVASSAAALAKAAVHVFFTLRLLPTARVRVASISMATIRRLLSFSVWTLIQGVANFVRQAAPAMILNRYASAVDVAAFHLGYLPQTQIRKLATATGAPTTATLTSLYSTDGEEALRPLYYRGGRYYLWTTLFLTPPLIALAVPGVKLYVGETYLDAAIVMALILGHFPFIWASAMFYRIAYAVEKIHVFNICSLSEVAAVLAGLYYFVVMEDMGAIGAAIAIAGGSTITHLLVLWPLGLRLVNGSWASFFRLTVLMGCAPFVAALAACFAYLHVVGADDWPKFFAGCGLSAIVYLAALLAFCLDETDKDLMRKGFGKAKRALKLA